MLTATALPRVFIYQTEDEEVRLTDPSDKLTIEAVRNFYANTYPILTTATIEGPEIINDEIQYRFTTHVGTKG